MTPAAPHSRLLSQHLLRQCRDSLWMGPLWGFLRYRAHLHGIIHPNTIVPFTCNIRFPSQGANSPGQGPRVRNAQHRLAEWGFPTRWLNQSSKSGHGEPRPCCLKVFLTLTTPFHGVPSLPIICPFLCVILWFIVRNVNLVIVTVSGTELSDEW